MTQEELEKAAQESEDSIKNAILLGGNLNKKLTSARLYDMYYEAMKKRKPKFDDVRTVFVSMLVILNNTDIKQASIVAHVVTEALMKDSDNLQEQFKKSPFASFAAAYLSLVDAVEKVNFNEDK